MNEPQPPRLDYATPPPPRRHAPVRRYLALGSVVAVLGLAWFCMNDDPREPGPMLPLSILYTGGVVLWVVYDWTTAAARR